MKKFLSVLMVAVTLFCSFGMAALAAEVQGAETRATEISVLTNRLYVSSGALKYNITITGASGTTKVGFKNVKVYRYGTYWAYEGSFGNQSSNSSSFSWTGLSVPDVGSGSYRVVLTAYVICNGKEYTTEVTSPSVVL